MNTIIRKATRKDAPQFLSIKDQLPMTMADGTTTKGGFLLGTDLNTYLDYIEQAYCLVAEFNDQIVGFGILLPDEMLRLSDIWRRRHSADWSIDLNAYENQQLCYFEQLAFLNGHRKTVINLAYNLVQWAFADGHTTLFTTTVHKPILNLAAVPFIMASGGIKAGNINEFYPNIGAINSDIYLLESPIFQHKVKQHPLYTYLTQQQIELPSLLVPAALC